MPVVAPPLPAVPAFPAALLLPLLDVSLTAINLLRPVYQSGGLVIEDFTLEYLNPAGQRIMHLPEQPGGTLLTHLPHALATGIFAFYRHVYETGEAGRYHLNYPLNGLDQYFRLAARRCEDSLLVSFTADETQAHPERRAAEQALRASEAREQAARTEAEAQRGELQRVVAQAPVAIAIARGPDLVVEAANPAILALWGKPPEEALGKPLLEAVPEAPGPGHRALFESVLRTGQPVVAREHAAPNLAAGSLKTPFFDFVYQPLRDEQGQITGVITVATEVTQLVQTRQQVQDLNEQLAAANGKLQGVNAGLLTTNAELLTTQAEQVTARHLVQRLNAANVQRLNAELAVSNEELRSTNQELLASNQQLMRTNGDLDNFIYTASHDLKAPISNIEGLLTALLVELPLASRMAEPVRPLLSMMQGAIERFQLTLSQLTDISRLQQAHAQVPEQLNLAALVEHVRLDLAPLLAAAGARLTVEVQACPSISFSPKNLRSIVYNLLSNAVKYQDPARLPLVQLRCYRRGTAVVLEVQDNGLGLNALQQGKLFQMFVRLHDHVPGSGIGLYMVKKIVENAGGTIAVHSQPGVGSTFAVTLPEQVST